MKQELNFQVKFLKFCGIFDTSPAKWTGRIKFYQSFVIFASSYTTLMLATFIFKNYSNILLVAECIAPLFTYISMILKYLFLLSNLQEIFELIKEIKDLNGKCEFHNIFKLII